MKVKIDFMSEFFNSSPSPGLVNDNYPKCCKYPKKCLNYTP